MTEPTLHVRSYEANRARYVTLLADYYPFRAPRGTELLHVDEDAVYEIHVDNDNNGDAREDLTFRCSFSGRRRMWLSQSVS